jgi:hypothetical protein
MEMEGNFGGMGIDMIEALNDYVFGVGNGINCLMMQSDGGLL